MNGSKDINESNMPETYNTENKKSKKHNGIISFWKFMFTLMIIALHVGLRMKSMLDIKLPNKNIFNGGSIGVEIFFIVSGYLITKNAFRVNTENSNLGVITFKYIWKKIKVFFPYILIAYLCALILHIKISNLKDYQVINTIWDILLLRMSGIKYWHGVLGVAWYISAMLICMIILYPLAIKYKKNFIYIIAPLNVIFVGGWISHTYGNIADPEVWTGIVYKSLLRAFFELSLGAIAYQFSEYIKSINFTKLGRRVLTFIEIFGFLSIFYFVNKPSPHDKYDFIMILILFISISIAFSEKSILQNFGNNKVFYYLEKISLPMYLNQIWTIEIILKLIKNYNVDLSYYQITVITIMCIFILAIFTEKLVKIMKKSYPKIKKVFITEKVEI